MTDASAAGDPAGGLEGIRAAVAAGNPELYRHIALYLQVLRNVLPERVERACFHLATQVYVQRYLSLPASQRLELHQLLRDRVRRCCSLLTVEQLVALARRLDQEQQEQQGQRQRALLKRLLRSAEGDADSPTTRSADAETDSGTPQAATGALPPGSVQLGFSPPLDPALLSWWPPAPPADHPQPKPEDGWDREGDREPGGLEAQQRAAADLPGRISRHEPTAGPASEQSPDQPTDADDDRDSDDEDSAELMAALLQGLLDAEDADPAGASGPFSEEAAASEGDDQVGPAGAAVWRSDAAAPGPGPSDSADEDDGVIRTLFPAGIGLQGPGPVAPTAPSSPWDQVGLPTDPVQLLQWLDGLERALARQLRNLSHAINVDLLRLGLSRGLLPVSLLEAVLQGQLETLASPANVLRLQLPFGLRPGAPPMQTAAILLRPVDLEMDEPRLRTCRRRIHQHRQQVRKMAHSYRRLQRRLQAHEAERLWLQDIRASRTEGS